LAKHDRLDCYYPVSLKNCKLTEDIYYRAIDPMKVLFGMMITFRNSGYTEAGNCFPVGNDPTVKNSGKFCALRYEKNDAGWNVQLIKKHYARADYRSSEDSSSEIGTYIPSIIEESGEVGYLKATKFKRCNLCGYWHALMKYYFDGENKIPYDKDYSREHFALVSFPAKYGESGTMTFILNEEGKIYGKDLGESVCLDTYPGPNPPDNGWERIPWNYSMDDCMEQSSLLRRMVKWFSGK